MHATKAMIQRRSFLGAILAAGVAPAFVRAGVLMPVKEIWTPPDEVVLLHHRFGSTSIWNRAFLAGESGLLEVAYLDGPQAFVIGPANLHAQIADRKHQ